MLNKLREELPNGAVVKQIDVAKLGCQSKGEDALKK